MERDGTWGGNMELVAISRALGINITVHQLKQARFDIRADADPEAAGGSSGSSTRTIHLGFHDFEHYSSVRSEREMGHAPASSIEVSSG